MTTIAITETEIAADGQRTWGGEIRGKAFDKVRVKGSAIYSFTGVVPMFDPVVEWHLAGADAEKLPAGFDHKTEGWTLIVISKQGLMKYTSSCPYAEEFEPPIAFGAGGEYAIGAMLHGASAREAVEIVSNLCNHTGGRIKVIDIASVTGFTLARTVIKEAAE